MFQWYGLPHLKITPRFLKKSYEVLYIIRANASVTFTVHYLFFLKVCYFIVLIWFINILFFQGNFFFATVSFFYQVQ